MRPMAGELERLHDRIDEVQKDLTGARIDLADIKARLPVQPCPQIKEHLAKHLLDDDRKWALYLKLFGAAISGGGVSGMIVWLLKGGQ
jgi:3-oxoacyl-[acyl-carrier-protein] synthase III